MTVKTAATPVFEALLADLSTLAKATDVNQERIAAGRAAEGHMQEGTTMAKSEEEKKKEKERLEHEEEERKKKAKNAGGEHHEGKGGKEHMAKSFTLQTEDGGTIEVQDASELLKALDVRLTDTTASVQEALGSVVNVMKGQGELIKSMTEKLSAQGETLAAQDTLIKSLRDDLAKFGAAPGGRKAVVTVAERTTASATDLMTKAGMPEGITVEDFFAKCSDLQVKGKITGVDIAIAEASLNSGKPVPEGIVRRVMAASA